MKREIRDHKPEDITGGVQPVNVSGPKLRHRRGDPTAEPIIPAEQASHYEVKTWPVMGDYDYEGRTNALGYPLEDTFGKEKLAREQAERQKLLEAQSLLPDNSKAALNTGLAGTSGELQTGEIAGEIEELGESAEILSREDVERIKKYAAEEGHKEGYEVGYQEGLAKGVEDGTAKGRDAGIAAGREEGMEKGYAEGFEKGRSEGFNKGQEQGITSGEQIVLQQAERFRHLADCLGNPLRELDRDVTDELVYMVSRLCAVILGHEIKNDSGYLQRAIQSAITVLPDAEGSTTLRLNPDDAVMLEAAIGQDYISRQGWKLVPDESVKPGDVTAERGSSQISVLLDKNIDVLLNDFLINAREPVESALKEDLENAPNWNEEIKPLPPEMDLKTAVGLPEPGTSTAPASDAAAAAAATVSAASGATAAAPAASAVPAAVPAGTVSGAAIPGGPGAPDAPAHEAVPAAAANSVPNPAAGAAQAPEPAKPAAHQASRTHMKIKPHSAAARRTSGGVKHTSAKEAAAKATAALKAVANKAAAASHSARESAGAAASAESAREDKAPK